MLENAIDQVLGDAVTLEVEETYRHADLAQFRGGSLASARHTGKIRRDIERRNLFVGIRMIHQIDGLLVVADFAAHIMRLGVARFQVHVGVHRINPFQANEIGAAFAQQRLCHGKKAR